MCEEWISENSPGYAGKRKCVVTGREGMGAGSAYIHFPINGLQFKKDTRASQRATTAGSLGAPALSFPSLDQPSLKLTSKIFGLNIEE